MSDRRYYFAAGQRCNNTGDNEDDDDEDCNDALLYSGHGNNNHNSSSNNNKSQLNDNENAIEIENEADQAEANEPDVDKDDDSEFLQDVPYSSSSIDRSSIGSIPWADDAIKKNKLDWERVELMLSGEQPLPEAEPELRSEIADWQHKFPQLLLTNRKANQPQNLLLEGNRACRPANMIDDSADIDSISNLSLNSLQDIEDDEDDDDGFLTPTAEPRKQLPLQAAPQSQHQAMRKFIRPTYNLVDILDKDLRISSVRLRKRERCTPSATASPPRQQQNTHSASAQRSRLRMPPILNVLDSNRRFRGLLNNRSFVQLTRVEQQEQQQQHPHKPQLQAKSAALTHVSSAERRQGGNRSAWLGMPVAAAAAFNSRFLNNKHAIVLPALNRQRDFSVATAATVSSNQSNTSGAQSHNNRSTLGRNVVIYNNQHQQYQHHLHHQFNAPLARARITTNSSNTPSTGRSISAAVHHPRSEFVSNSAFYIPYSASKFKAFK